jgi:hypothetical protein
MKAVLALALAAALTLAADVPARVLRATITDIERNFNRRLERWNVEDPVMLLGMTRGLYLDNYGVVFTTELNLVAAATVTPFRPAFNKEELARLRQKKLERVATLKELMREMLIDAAPQLSTVPLDQQIVLGINVLYHQWEDTAGLPGQIVMQAPRKALLDRNSAAKSIRVQEY